MRAALTGALAGALLCFGASAADTPVGTDCRPAAEAQAAPVRLEAERLQRAYAATPASPARAATALALGRVLATLNRRAEAETLLAEATDTLAAPTDRAQSALELGNLRWNRRDAAGAEQAWSQALALVDGSTASTASTASGDADGRQALQFAVELNRLRAAQAPRRLERLQALATRLEAAPMPPTDAHRIRSWLNLGARAMEAGDAGRPLAQQAYTRALQGAQAAADATRSAEALDALAELHERSGQPDAALDTALRALAAAQSSPYRDLLITIEARIGRLSLAQGDDGRAVAAYRRAVAHIAAVRADIPVVYEDGRSSFRDTLAPVYLGLTDALLQQAAKAEPTQRDTLLRSARATVELSKQSEMEDYLLDRCTVQSTLAKQPYTPPPGTAVLYPVMLPDRLELLLETASGIERASSPIGADALRQAVQTFVTALRAGAPFRGQAERLHRSLLGPVQPALTAQGIQTLVFVPDGVLRLLPLAALHDGRSYVIARHDLVTVPAMGVLGAAQAPASARRVLLAGLSEPGPVVERLTPAMVRAIGVESALQRTAGGTADGGVGASGAAPATEAEAGAARLALQQALALPGVKVEVEGIARDSGGTALINRDFTVAGLQKALLEGDQNVLHIASHGSFGETADQTFLMAYDGLLTLDTLQQMLKSERFQRRPLDLITLSACQTAEGDDRAPLGMSGAAIKARARSALGTLWPVNDAAALEVMVDFYRRMAAGAGKAAALRQAQLALLAKPGYQHPFYWAPFTLVGDWQ